MGGLVSIGSKIEKVHGKFSPAERVKRGFERRVQDAVFGPKEQRGPWGNLFSTTTGNFHTKLEEGMKPKQAQIIRQQSRDESKIDPSAADSLLRGQ